MSAAEGRDCCTPGSDPTLPPLASSYGAFWALSPAFLADRFGPRAYGAVTATSALSVAVGSYALSAGMAASLYEASIGPGGGTECVGRRCFGGSFVALAVLCAGVALPFAAWLALRTRLLYRSCGESVGYDAYEGLVGPEARWKRQLRRRCYACCCCAWGEGLVGDSHEFEDGPQEVTRD